MKLTFLLITTLLVQISAASLAQKITINQRNVAMDKVLAELRNQSGYDFLYTTQTLKGIKPVSITLQGASLQEALDACFKNQPITYVIQQNTVVIQRKTEFFKNTFVPPIDVKGKVLDENGLPLLGATIQVKGARTTVLTNGEGIFELKGIDEKAILLISFVGYKPKEIQVGSSTNLTISLELNPALLSEIAVVSTGYQNIPKERAAGSIDVINADKDLQGKLQLNILDRIEGMSAGLTSYKVAGNTQIRIRGISTISGNSNPLYVVDGAPFEGDIQSINPSDVENISILKDATAASIYGARSANGVIVINTRKGKKGPLRVNYSATVKFTPLPDRGYTNKMTSAELVDFQREMFNYRSGSYSAIDPRKAMNEVYRLFYEQREGNITEAQLQTALDVYRNSDRYDQVLKEYIRKTAMDQQHNLSFSGGSDFYSYNLSGNYLGSNPYEREQTRNRIGFNLNNTFNFTKWMKFDVGVLGSNVKEDYDNGVSGVGMLNTGKASYFMLRDESGNPIKWLNSKSQFEIDRLNGLRLLDENYAPVNEMNKKHYTFNSNYLNLNIGANFKIIDGLSLNLLFQKERTEEYRKQFSNKDAYAVKTQINNATIVKSDGKIERLIPIGGQLNETRGDQNSHTLRAQFNYNKLFGEKHRVDIIAGTEQRKIVSSSTDVYKYGYDDYSLSYKPINELALSQATLGTEDLFGRFQLSRAERGFLYGENRYVSFYGNGSYTFDRKITATASIRMDQSNLFGTDPKYQYKPLWSAGLLYVISENQNDWLDRLAVRTTYGINGNIPKDSGPYMISMDSTSPNYYTNEAQSSVYSPPNSGLRWEKTKVTNLAVDFSVLKSRLTGSIEFYNKSTTDLLGRLNSDPTIGWSDIIVNYGSMRNRGVDISLNSVNMVTTDFKWGTTVNFNYNKNKLTRLENSGNTIFSYVDRGQNRVGVPMNSLYSINYKGLDNAGRPIALTKDGREVKGTDQLVVDDLIYGGTATPPYAASMMNNLSYKNFDLFFMFIYYGGHVMRDVSAPYLTKYAELNYTSNIERNALNYWKKPGDEQIDGIAPGFYTAASSTITQLWEAADRHIQKADYIKLRDITLGYSLANDKLRRNYIQKLRFSFQVQNAWRWSANKQNLDPEVWSGTTLTPSRGALLPLTYTFGLSANF
ncbi:SusC/RagA family TonB-linked outer membrane protein [Pedobacter frigoris]|nr:SusC/RagA family TonB-linked outer membrane protein [Pedobacter frigoris]